MAKELFAGQRKNKYRIVVSKEALSKKNLVPLLKEHNKVLIITDDGVPSKIVKKVTDICKRSGKVSKIILDRGEKAKSLKNFQKILNFDPTKSEIYYKLGKRFRNMIPVTVSLVT